MKNRIAIITLSLLAVLALAACSGTAATVSTPNVRSINVTGTGEVYLTPDVAYVNVGVQNQGPTVTDVLDQNTAQAQGIRDALKELGVEDKDIQTSGFNVYPNNTYDTNGLITGTYYSASNTVFVTVRDLSKLGHILDAVVRNGANTINSINFSVLDPSQALTQARELAVKDAQSQADQLVTLTGEKLGNVQYLNIYSNNPIPMYEGKGGGGGTYYDMATNVPVSSGQLVISVSVNITWELK
jgi:uncharacterized protein YggE